MKISTDHFESIRSAVEALNTPELREQYRTGDFPRSDHVRDLDERYRWDLFWIAWGINQAIRDAVEGLNDSHIDTALRRIVSPL